MKADQLLSTSLEAQTRGPQLTAHLEGLKSDRRVSALPEISSPLEDLGVQGRGAGNAGWDCHRPALQKETGWMTSGFPSCCLISRN